jgi:uncharacterized protein (TIGR02453 family)
MRNKGVEIMSASQGFSGFPQAGLQFLADLASNNEREWFEEHKPDYMKFVRDPALEFIEALGSRLKTINKNIVYDTRTNGSGSLMRIYRDVRFSKDKSPYKTNVGIVFWEDAGGKLDNSGYYFHLEPGGAMMYAGIYHFEKPVLAAYRKAVLDDQMGAALQAVIDQLRAEGYKITGEHYKRVPSGLPADHPRAALLRHDSLGAHSLAIPPDVVESPQLVDVCFEHCQHLLPIEQWLARLMGEVEKS